MGVRVPGGVSWYLESGLVPKNHTKSEATPVSWRRSKLYRRRAVLRASTAY
jgi:hypothetical protein